MVTYTCPVCGYDGLEYPPAEFMICPSCGTEFGNDDFELSYAELRQRWINNGMRWWSDARAAPKGWNPFRQLQQFTGILYAARETTSTQYQDLTVNKPVVRISGGVEFPR